MTYDQWMKDTAAFGRPRSTELKALDNALKTYELAAANSAGSVLTEKKALQQALADWKTAQKAKGQDWRASVRNKLKAVEKLDAELNHVIVGAGGLNSRGEVLDTEDLKARKELVLMIKQNTRAMFIGQKLTIRNGKALADANTVRSALTNFKNDCAKAGAAAKGAAAVTPDLRRPLDGLITKLFGDASVADVQSALGPIYADFLGSVAPFVGAIKSGKDALVKWGQAALTLYKEHKMKDARSAFAPGDPAEAFESILRILNAEMQAYAATATIHTAAAAAKAAFTAADLGAVSGPAVGAAETLAVLVQKIYLFARDWNEVKQANELLDQGVFDFRLFQSSPLVGCYLIANSDHAAIINIAVADYGKTGWTFDVEVMRKKAEPVIVKAHDVIRASRFEFAGLQGMKGTVVNRNAKVLGLPKGKLDGLIDDVSKGISKRVQSLVS